MLHRAELSDRRPHRFHRAVGPQGLFPSRDQDLFALAREDQRFQIVTIADILAGARINLPMGRSDAVKSAEAVGDIVHQQSLTL